MDKLTVFVNEYISELDKHKAKQEKIQLKSSNEPDEDGFVTVSYSNTNKGASHDGITVKAFKADEVIEIKKKEQSSFYRFQTRENKRDRKFYELDNNIDINYMIFRIGSIKKQVRRG